MAKRNPTYVVTKPKAAELRAVKSFAVDKVIRWAQENGYCSEVDEALTLMFGKPPVNGWRDSEGFDCYQRGVDGIDRGGFDESGFDKDGYDKRGLHRETRRTVDGYDYSGYDLAGFNRDGINRRGQHRDHVAAILDTLSIQQKAELKAALADFDPTSDNANDLPYDLYRRFQSLKAND